MIQELGRKKKKKEIPNSYPRCRRISYGGKYNYICSKVRYFDRIKAILDMAVSSFLSFFGYIIDY